MTLRALKTSLSRRLTHEAGFTLVEVMVAVLILSTGLIAAMSVVDGANDTTVFAQRNEQAVSYAEREIERLRALPYADLRLNRLPTTEAAGVPAGDTNPRDPNFYVNGANFRIMTDYRDSSSGPLDGTPAAGEAMVGPVPGSLGTVDPGPTAFSSGGATGRIYRYVTDRNEECEAEAGGQARCAGTADSKRVTLAVVLDGGGGPLKPIWFQTVVADPRQAPPNSDRQPLTNPGDSPPVTAQDFFLYDTPCTQTGRQEIIASHPTRNTSQRGSNCEPASEQPDLMAEPSVPGDQLTTPIYDYSSEFARATPQQGLALRATSRSCAPRDSQYSSEDAATAKQELHTWSTRALFADNDFALPSGEDPRAVLQVFSRTRDGAATDATLCITVRSSGSETGSISQSYTYRPAGGWPREWRELPISFTLARGARVAANQRLLLTISALSTDGGGDIELLYDHPAYQSFFQVATTTPLP